MGSIPDQFPISLRAWPSKNDSATALTSLITRINTERGNFRNVTEDSLEEEIRQSEAGRDAGKGEEGSDEDEADEEEPDRLKELATAREEILSQLEQAHNASMVALDFVSLLLSKDTPVQASLSISQQLKDAVPLGSVGSDKLNESRVSIAQRDDNRHIAKGWKLQSLNDTVDSLLNSATRLEKEIESETKYWEQILTVSEKGWALCRIPQEKHTLGVRFGFSESAPAFKNRNLAALRRNADGTISLDQGIADPTPKRLRVRIQTNGEITGELPPSTALPDPTSVEALILSARNTIFEEELWQELNREARILANHGVRLTGDEISCPITATKRIILDLVPIEEDEITNRDRKEDDKISQMISLSLHVLLSYAHRQNLRRRSHPPPPISVRPPPNPPYYIIRALIVFLHHQTVLTALAALLGPLNATLRSTGIVHEDFTVKTPPVNLINATDNAKSVPEQVIESLVFDLSAEISIPITASNPSQALNINLRTNTDPRYALEAHFSIAATGPLAISCKPPPTSTSVNEVKTYILWAVACALAEAFVYKSDEGDDATFGGGNKDRSSGWSRTHDPTVLRKAVNDERDHMELAFRAVLTDGGAVEIGTLWRFMAADGEKGKVKRLVWGSQSGGEKSNIRDAIDELSDLSASEREPVEDGVAGLGISI